MAHIIFLTDSTAVGKASLYFWIFFLVYIIQHAEHSEYTILCKLYNCV